MPNKKMTWEEFLAELDKINPLENKENWFKKGNGNYVIFSEFNNIYWYFINNGKIIVTDTSGNEEINIELGEYDFEDMIEKIKVWFI